MHRRQVTSTSSISSAQNDANITELSLSDISLSELNTADNLTGNASTSENRREQEEEEDIDWERLNLDDTALDLSQKVA
jgi:hypothetical protein